MLEYNTTHDNVGDNRSQSMGGSIANINDYGTFTHVEAVDLNVHGDDY